jgi:hypothetical protein
MALMSKSISKAFLRKQDLTDLLGENYDQVLERKRKGQPIYSRETQNIEDINALGMAIKLVQDAGLSLSPGLIRRLVPMMYQEGAGGGMQVKEEIHRDMRVSPEGRQVATYAQSVPMFAADIPSDYISAILKARQLEQKGLPYERYNGKGTGTHTTGPEKGITYDANIWRRNVSRLAAHPSLDIESMLQTGMRGQSPAMDPRFQMRQILGELLSGVKTGKGKAWQAPPYDFSFDQVDPTYELLKQWEGR